MSEPMRGRAVTPEQKRVILQRLATAWEKASELRLGQLIESATAGQSPLLYYVEDEDLIRLIEEASREQRYA